MLGRWTLEETYKIPVLLRTPEHPSGNQPKSCHMTALMSACNTIIICYYIKLILIGVIINVISDGSTACSPHINLQFALYGSIVDR